MAKICPLTDTYWGRVRLSRFGNVSFKKHPSGNAGYKRGKQPKMSTSGLLDVSHGVEHNRAEERSGGRKRKSTPRGRKVSEGEVEADAGGDLGKKRRRGRGK